jgi:hypothetical protein
MSKGLLRGDNMIIRLLHFSYSERTFFEDATTRHLLKRFTADSARGVKLTPLSESDKHKLLSSVKKVSKPLFDIINEIDGNPTLLQVYRKFLYSTASPSPVCSFVRPCKPVESLVKAIVSWINIREETLMWKNVHNFLPILFEVFENQNVTPNMQLLVNKLWNIAVSPFIYAKEDQQKSTLTYSQDDELSFFPCLPKYRSRGRFQKDASQVKNTEHCTKKYAGHPSLLPGVFTIFCPHGELSIYIVTMLLLMV